MRTPSAGPRRTSVDRPRIVEVTGALMTDRSNRPIGSRLRTTMGRTLSRRASHTSPRRGDLSVVFAVGMIAGLLRFGSGLLTDLFGLGRRILAARAAA